MLKINICIQLEIHAAAKETVALAEERFMTNSHNWNFDNTWQEVLNHATHRVSVFPFYLFKYNLTIGVWKNLFHIHRSRKLKKRRLNHTLNIRVKS